MVAVSGHEWPVRQSKPGLGPYGKMRFRVTEPLIPPKRPWVLLNQALTTQDITSLALIAESRSELFPSQRVDDRARDKQKRLQDLLLNMGHEFPPKPRYAGTALRPDNLKSIATLRKMAGLGAGTG